MTPKVGMPVVDTITYLKGVGIIKEINENTPYRRSDGSIDEEKGTFVSCKVLPPWGGEGVWIAACWLAEANQKPG